MNYSVGIRDGMDGYRTRDHLDDFRSKCTECGQCREVCPSYAHGGCDPLAVMLGDNSKVWDCVGCGNCSRVCGSTDPKSVMLAVYSINLDVPVSQCFLDTGLSRPLDDHPARDEVPPEWDGDDVYVMPGCIVRCLAPHLEYSASVAMRAIGAKATELEGFTCCMYPIQFGVMTDSERDGYRLRMGEMANGKDMVTMCAGCSEIMGKSGVRCEHIIPYLHRNLDKLPRTNKKLRVSLEPGCAAMEFRDEMEEIVTAMGFEPIGNEPGCCGKSSRNVAAPLMSERQAASQDADAIVVGCPMCYTRYDACEGGKPVLYITELVALAYGDCRTLRYHRTPL